MSIGGDERKVMSSSTVEVPQGTSGNQWEIWKKSGPAFKLTSVCGKDFVFADIEFHAKVDARSPHVGGAE